MRTIVLAGVAGVAVAAAVGFAAPAQAAPCSYFGADAANRRVICGVPDLAGSLANAGTNLQNNFDPQRALDNLQRNLDAGTAADNLQKNLGLG
jgi:hypothetical protein